MKCKLCDASAELSRFPALQEGWTLVEIYGQQGNKYLAACPTHGNEAVLSAVKGLLETVTGKKGKKA